MEEVDEDKPPWVLSKDAFNYQVLSSLGEIRDNQLALLKLGRLGLIGMVFILIGFILMFAK